MSPILHVTCSILVKIMEHATILTLVTTVYVHLISMVLTVNLIIDLVKLTLVYLMVDFSLLSNSEKVAQYSSSLSR